MKIKLTDIEKETLSYDDVAYLILKGTKRKIKLQDLYKKVLKLFDIPESEYENSIGDFFELIYTDKRFIMLENGYCDLKINHSTKIIMDDDIDDYEVSPEEDIDNGLIYGEIEEDNYDDESVEDDETDDLKDLIIIDENEETDNL